MATFDIREGNTSLNRLETDVSASHEVTNNTRSPITVCTALYQPVGTAGQKLTVDQASLITILAGATETVDYSAITDATGLYQISPSETVVNTFDALEIVSTTPLKKSKAKAKTEGA